MISGKVHPHPQSSQNSAQNEIEIEYLNRSIDLILSENREVLFKTAPAPPYTSPGRALVLHSRYTLSAPSS